MQRRNGLPRVSLARAAGRNEAAQLPLAKVSGRLLIRGILRLTVTTTYNQPEYGDFRLFQPKVGIKCHDLTQEIDMPTRNVVLTDHEAMLVENLVISGRYQNASEILRDGLRLIEQREAEDASRLEALRGAVRVGVADMEQGRYTALDSPESLEKHLSALTRKAIQNA